LINISWLPYWHPIEDYASSRLRCLFHHQNINKNHSDEFNSSLEIHDNTNILIITQKIKNTDLNTIIEFKKKNLSNILIYDIVDNHYNEPLSKKIFNLCDFIFVANEAQYQLISKHTLKKIFIIPDSIDYPDQLDDEITKFNNNIVWFGNNTNVNCMIGYLRDLTLKGYTVNIIGKCDYLRNKVRSVNCIEWSYNSFIKSLKNNCIAILGHDEDQQQKSNNKLLVCIANGIPVISCNSKSYSELLKKFNLSYAIINQRQDLIKSVKLLSQNNVRVKYLENIQPYIIEKYNSEAITNELIYVIKDILQQKRDPLSIELRSLPPREKKILIYTANFKSYDKFNEISVAYNEIFDYVYITDRHFRSNTWDVRTIEIKHDGFLDAKMYKILPHKFFPEYDISIWIDASAKDIKSNFQNLLIYLNNHNMILPKHPSRTCLFSEAEVCIRQKKDNETKILNQIQRYKNLEFPEDSGLYACGFMIRKHNEIIEFSEAWWNEILNNSKRDQISFPFILNQFKKLLKIHTFRFKDCLDYFKWTRHGSIPLIKPRHYQKDKRPFQRLGIAHAKNKLDHRR